MIEFVTHHEAGVRLAAFVGLLALFAVLEAWRPRRVRTLTRAQRWPSNLGIIVLDSVLVKVLMPVVAVGAAAYADAQGVGLFNIIALPPLVAVVAAMLLLDLLIYGQHVAVHHIPVLWRLHRVHHTDVDLDVTSGFRFHPLEILLSMWLKVGFVLLLGAPVVAVILFEVILSSTALFNHANLRIPPTIERWLRLVIVTPDLHRVHHSVKVHETNSNFGFNIPWWDRLFGTYRAQPEAGHDAMIIGQPVFRDAASTRLDRLLIQPFQAGDPHR